MMTYADACRALGLVSELVPLAPHADQRQIAELVRHAFKQRAKEVHPDTAGVGTGAPTIDQLKEARALILRVIAKDCGACKGIGHMVVMGRPVQCPSCGGTGKDVL